MKSKKCQCGRKIKEKHRKCLVCRYNALKLCHCGQFHYDSEEFDRCWKCAQTIKDALILCILCGKNKHTRQYRQCFTCSEKKKAKAAEKQARKQSKAQELQDIPF